MLVGRRLVASRWAGPSSLLDIMLLNYSIEKSGWEGFLVNYYSFSFFLMASMTCCMVEDSELWVALGGVVDSDECSEFSGSD